MGANILDLGCTIQCPHGGQATVTPGHTKVNVGGNLALLATDTMLIGGCTFAPGGVPSPCVSIQWTGPAIRDTVNGTPVLLQTSVGLCLNAARAPQGTATVSGAQTQVRGE
jgi:hypothetical protein